METNSNSDAPKTRDQPESEANAETPKDTKKGNGSLKPKEKKAFYEVFVDKRGKHKPT